ncbi:MAG: hypothetical protein HQK78_01540 [Desulfobacterales bacterium]|nr:hypothetical protein [Desulfobacterales bacterium]
MSEKLKKLWMIVGGVWLAVFIVTYINISKIDEITENKITFERFKKNERFLKDSDEHIKKMLKKAENLYHSVASLSLGLLTIEKKTIKLSEKYNISDFKLESTKDISPEKVPIIFSFNGDIKNSLYFLEEIQTGYPFLQFKEMTINVFPTHALFKVSLYYRYKIIEETTSVY